MKNEITVILVEDQPEYRKVVEMALEETEDIKLTTIFGTAEKALRYVSDHPDEQADIILLDLNLFGMGGIEALPLLKKSAPRSEVIILTNSNRESDVLAAISNGASGYLLKSSTVDEVAEGIRAVHAGGASLDPQMARYLLNNVILKKPETSADIHLSKRKQEVLELIAQGLVKKQIATELNIGYSTVESYVKSIYDDLGVSNAPSAVSKAYQKGLLNGRG